MSLLGLPHIPHSVPAIAAAFSLIMMAGARMAKRVYTERGAVRELTGEPVIVYGAGFIGGMVMDSMLHDEEAKLRPVAVFDDDQLKAGTKFHGISVITTYRELEQVIRESGTRKILVTISDMSEDYFESFCNRMRKLKVEVQRISSANARLMGERLITASDNDLMRVIRGEINYDIDRDILRSYLHGKRVLVTGAGGSIGSELCRQISEFEPETLMMLDHDETLLMETKVSITHESSLDDDRIILADIREGDNLLEIFRDRRPEVVFHAAALKHVSALEAYPQEAWKTNSLGTLNVLRASEAVGVKTFVNVSTDKAADPKTALGQSKRVAERLTAYFGEKTGNTYVSVRFGNVFGSRGSIKPLFTKQILSGGPITLTDRARDPLLHAHRRCLPARDAGRCDWPSRARSWCWIWASRSRHAWTWPRRCARPTSATTWRSRRLACARARSWTETLFGRYGEARAQRRRTATFPRSSAPAPEPGRARLRAVDSELSGAQRL